MAAEHSGPGLVRKDYVVAQEMLVQLHYYTSSQECKT